MGVPAGSSTGSGEFPQGAQKPRLTIRAALDVAADPASVGARLVLHNRDGSERNVAVLAYTLVPNMVFGEPDGEMTSVLVSALLNHGFQLSFSASYTEILQHAVPARDTCTCTMAAGGTIQLHVDGALMHSQQLNIAILDDAAWLEAAKTGSILVVSGDNLMFTETDLQLTAAAELGTLVTGIVPALV